MDQKKRRRCLKCGKMFTSLRFGYRMCQKCAQDNASVGRRTEPHSVPKKEERT